MWGGLSLGAVLEVEEGAGVDLVHVYTPAVPGCRGCRALPMGCVFCGCGVRRICSAHHVGGVGAVRHRDRGSGAPRASAPSPGIAGASSPSSPSTKAAPHEPALRPITPLVRSGWKTFTEVGVGHPLHGVQKSHEVAQVDSGSIR